MIFFRSFIPVLVIIAISVQGCSGYGDESDIFVMEELEKASSIGDPARRVERLEVFIETHRGHLCRRAAYNDIFDAMTVDMDKTKEAVEYLDEVLKKEKDSRVRSSIIYRKFSYLWDSDSLGAVKLSESLLENGNEDFRLFLYMGMYFSSSGNDDIAARLFRKGMERAADSSERSFAGMLYGENLLSSGRETEALRVLKESRENVFSHKYLGEILWKRGDREEAIESYIQLAAGVPGERSEAGLDSLFAIVYPDSAESLQERILRARTGERRLLCEDSFEDTGGKKHDLKDYKGRKLVIVAWSPT